MNLLSKYHIKAAILDMDGVLWKMNSPLCDLQKLFDDFKANHIRVVTATNNGTSTVNQYLRKFINFDVKLDPTQVVTSAMAMGYLLKKKFPKGGPIYIVGEQALNDTLIEYGFFHDELEPQAVAAGLSRSLSYEMIKEASMRIQSGLPFYFTNPDPTFPTPEGNYPGAGTMLAALEAASGVKAIIAGKPQPYMYNLAMEIAQTEPDNTITIGDRLDTDILGGQRAGCRTALVLSGISDKKDLEKWEPKPDIVVENIRDLFNG
jgi:4-nitrophenyl phosphatase